MGLKLVVFDVDGTLVDSQDAIVGGMRAAFAATGREPPSRERMLSIVGLSLSEAFDVLVPGVDARENAALVGAYREAFLAARAGGKEGTALYPGVREALEELSRIPDLLLGIATGKARRGLDFVLENQGLNGVFHVIQTSDLHPSKPHPAMLEAALADAGVEPHDAVMLGDTTYDIEMAVAARVPAIGVSWGYHGAQALTGAGAAMVLDDIAALRGALDRVWD